MESTYNDLSSINRTVLYCYETSKYDVFAVRSRHMLTFHPQGEPFYTFDVNDAIFLDYPSKRIDREIKFHDCIIKNSSL